MKKLQHYCAPVKEAGRRVNAYHMDGGDTRHLNMANDMGFHSFERCDYFYFHKGKICLVEFKELQEEKVKQDVPLMQQLRRKFFAPLSFPEKEEWEERMFRHFTANTCIAKLYGSIMVLCRFAWKCEDTQNKMSRNKFRFEFVVQGALAKNSRALARLNSFLQNKMEGKNITAAVMGSKEWEQKVAKSSA